MNHLSNTFYLPSTVSMSLEKHFFRKWQYKYVSSLFRKSDINGNSCNVIIKDSTQYILINKCSPLTPNEDNVFLSFRKHADDHFGYVLVKNLTPQRNQNECNE